MGGDAKSVQHKVVHPMYVSYSSIPTSTANTTMKSTKLLTNPFNLDVTTTNTTLTSAATCNLNNSINNHNKHSNRNTNNNNNCSENNNNQKLMLKTTIGTSNRFQQFFTKLDPNLTDDSSDLSKFGNDQSNLMTFNRMQNNNIDHSKNFRSIDDNYGGKMSHATHSINIHGTNKKINGVVYRKANRNSQKNSLNDSFNNFCNKSINPKRNSFTSTRYEQIYSNGAAGIYRPYSVRYSDSDDTRSSSIDYNFNYAKFRSPASLTSSNQQQLQQQLQQQAHRDSSTTSTLATDSSSNVHASPFAPLKQQHHNRSSQPHKHQLLNFSNVHNHPNCRCSIQSCCPYADDGCGNTIISGFDKIESNQMHNNINGNDIVGVHERKCGKCVMPVSSRQSYNRRDLHATPSNYKQKVTIKDTLPEYHEIDFMYGLKRTLSQDRLFNQRHVSSGNRYSNRKRPKSYCSNFDYPTQL